MEIRQANLADLNAVVPLFDAYRLFYKQTSDINGARSFLTDRLEREQSTLLIAWDEARAVGFVQLYPLFSSMRMAPAFVLNDLFVSPDARGVGIGKALLEAARKSGREAGGAWLSLSTAVENVSAQALYERAGWTRETDFYAYGISLT